MKSCAAVSNGALFLPAIAPFGTIIGRQREPAPCRGRTGNRSATIRRGAERSIHRPDGGIGICRCVLRCGWRTALPQSSALPENRASIHPVASPAGAHQRRIRNSRWSGAACASRAPECRMGTTRRALVAVALADSFDLVATLVYACARGPPLMWACLALRQLFPNNR